MRAITPRWPRAGQAALWAAYDAIRCPTLLLRGADSDLLARATAAAMTRARPEGARCTSSPASAMRRRWSRRTRSRSCGSSCSRHEDRRGGQRASRRRRRSSDSSMRRTTPAADGADGEPTPPTDPVARARAFAAPLLAGRELPTGEGVLAHADGVAAILRRDRRRAGAARRGLPRPCRRPARQARRGADAALRRVAGDAGRACAEARRSCSARRRARASTPPTSALQTERVRKMLLAFSRDLRVVLLRLASRLQTLRFFAASKTPCPPELAAEAMQVFAPLANRLGIWQIKWELEDLAFRFLDPEHYQRDRRAARREARRSRGARRGDCAPSLGADLAAHGLARRGAGPAEAPLQHLEEDAQQGPRLRRRARRAARCASSSPTSPAATPCSAACTSAGRAIAGELDDYIARPKAERLPSLHTVVRGRRRPARSRSRSARRRCTSTPSTASRRTGPTRRPTRAATRRVSAGGRFEAQRRRGAPGRAAPAARLGARPRRRRRRRGAAAIAARRPAQRGASTTASTSSRRRPTVVELAAGATPIDFAYAVHTDLGHRCRGAKVDGVIVPLNTPLQSGQTVEITAAKSGGPSLDWLNPELGYLQSARSKAKVRAWFNALAQAATDRARPRGGREAAAARRQDGAQARRPGDAARLSQRRRAVRGRRQGRALAAQHRGAAAAGAGAERATPTRSRFSRRARRPSGGRRARRRRRARC